MAICTLWQPRDLRLRADMGEPIIPVSIETTNRKAAVACLAVTGYMAVCAAFDFIDPITKKPLENDFIADLAEFVEDANLAVGNPAKHSLREMIAKLRKLKAGKP